MTNTRKELSQLFKSGIISAENIEQALTITRIHPNHSAWKKFISQLLLWLGVLALTSSVVFFIAFNWDDLGRFAKFGLVEALIIFSIFIYWKSKNKASKSNNHSSQLISKAALFMASIFLGVLLAFYGQTYQTGADTWQLFLTWAVLIIPWVVISRFPVHWILWLGLINLSIFLYFKVFNGLFGILFSDQTNMLWIISGVNAIAFILWEALKTHRSWMLENWVTRLLAFASGAPLTFLVIISIFDGFNDSLLPLLFWAIGMLLIYWFYRKRQVDVFMLAMACLSGIIVIVSGASKVLFKNLSDDFGSFLLLAILVISLGGISAMWLKRLHVHQHRTQRDDTL